MKHSALLLGVVVTVLSLATIGCDDGSKKNDAARSEEAKPQTKPSVDKPDEADAAAPACGPQRGKAIEQEILALCELSPKVLRHSVATAPWSPRPSDIPDGVALIVRPGAVVVGWGDPVPLASVGSKLAHALESRTFSGQVDVSWVLSIDGQTPRAEVAELFAVLVDAGRAKGRLVLATKPTTPLPQPRDPKRLAALAATLREGDSAMRATILAKTIEQALPCGELKQTFSALASAKPELRCQLMARGISEGLVDCGCPPDDELLTLIYGVTVDASPPENLGIALPLTLNPTVASRRGATWADVVAGFGPAAVKGLWLVP